MRSDRERRVTALHRLLAAAQFRKRARAFAEQRRPVASERERVVVGGKGLFGMSQGFEHDAEIGERVR
jgi:hypothetical protein